MKKIIKRTFNLLLTGTMLACSLTGCGSGGNNGDDTGSGSAVQTDGTAGKTESGGSGALTIVASNNLILDDFVKAFHETYPEVELDLVSYAGMNASGYMLRSLELGDIPDIYVATQNFSKESQEKYLLDLSNYDFINNYSNTMLDAQDVNGGIYLLPTTYQLIGINYNKTIMEENGWEVPKDFHELVALAPEIEAAGYQAFGNGMSLDGFIDSFFFNIGNTIYFGTPEGTEWKEGFPKGEAKAVGNSDLKEVTEYFYEWIENGLINSEHMESIEFYEGGAVFYAALGISEYEHTAENGKTYEFGNMPWLSRDGSNNMLTRNVSRYFGLNKALAEKGNEQKLENALKFMEYISTLEGQKALVAGSNLQMPSLKESGISEDSPYYDVAGLVQEGKTVPLVYVGWEQMFTPMAEQLRRMFDGELDANGVLKALDEANEAVLNGVSDDFYGSASETLTLERTAALIAIAEGKAADADCAMVSLNEYHGADLCNKNGAAWYLYEGTINNEAVNIIRPRASAISVLEMTGAEIKAMRDAGFDLDGNGKPYEYLLFTKGGVELADDTVYKLAVSTNELVESMLADAVEIETAPADAIKAYTKELGTVSADVIRWD